MAIVLFLCGIVFLLAGAELLIRAAVRITAATGSTPLATGLTAVAVGTSSPEIAVSIAACHVGLPEVAVGTIVGSNVFNVLVILGVSAVMAPLAVGWRVLRFDVPLLLGATLLAWAFAAGGQISRGGAVVLLGALAAYVVSRMFVESRLRRQVPHEAMHASLTLREMGIAALFTVSGVAALAAGAWLLVTSCAGVAAFVGANTLFVSIIFVGAATSLPELAVSLSAHARGDSDFAVGNVVGSNIFNVLAGFGICAALYGAGYQIPEVAVRFHFPVLVAVAFSCIPIMVTGNVVSRLEGVLYLFYYGAYITLVALRAHESPALFTANRIMAFVILPATALALLTSLFVSQKQVTRLIDSVPVDIRGVVSQSARHARKVVIAVVGITILVGGVALLFLPGPGMVVIVAGFAVLATEFVWAKQVLGRIQKEAKNAVKAFASRGGPGTDG